MRPSWDAVWMMTADAVAARSLCSRAQVGAVIVSADNIVRAASYNGPAPGFDHGGKECSFWCRRATADELMPTYEDCWSTHAEMSAIARADRSTLDYATLYVTSAMCMPCAKVIPQTGITRVIHRVDASAAHREPDRVENYLSSVGIEVARMVDTPESIQAAFHRVDTTALTELAGFVSDSTCGSSNCNHVDCTMFQRAVVAILDYIELVTSVGLDQ